MSVTHISNHVKMVPVYRAEYANIIIIMKSFIIEKVSK